MMNGCLTHIKQHYSRAGRAVWRPGGRRHAEWAIWLGYAAAARFQRALAPNYTVVLAKQATLSDISWPAPQNLCGAQMASAACLGQTARLLGPQRQQGGRVGRRPLHVSAAGSTFGHSFRVTTFGESHGGGVGCVIDGVPPRMQITKVGPPPPPLAAAAAPCLRAPGQATARFAC